jgi:hypothetical protein
MRSARQDTAGDTKGHEGILMSENNKLDEAGEQEKIKIRPMDIAAGRKFSEVLSKHLREGAGNSDAEKWTYEKLSERLEDYVGPKTIERWRNGRNPPDDEAFELLCKIFWPDEAHNHERDRFVRLYNNMLTELTRRRDAAQRHSQRYSSSGETKAWDFFVRQSQEDCMLLARIMHAILSLCGRTNLVFAFLRCKACASAAGSER